LDPNGRIWTHKLRS